MRPKPMIYRMIVQCVRAEIGIIAEYEASTPFPAFKSDDSLELLDCDPRTWDVNFAVHRIGTAQDGRVFSTMLVLVDSPVVENTGCIVMKQSGERVGPSETRFAQDYVTTD